MNKKDRKLLELAKLFPPMGKDKETFNKANDEEKVRLIKKWQKEKSV